MKIQLFSDTHGLDDSRLSKEERMLFHEGAREADLIIVPGDCGGNLKQSLANLDSLQLEKPVLFVPGNHDFYGRAKINGKELDDIVHIHEDYRNIMVRSCSVYEQDNTVFLCATLWVDFELYGRAAEMAARKASLDYLHDYEFCPYLFRTPDAYCGSPEIMLDWHIKQREWLEEQLINFERAGKMIVVVTHHCPSEEVLDPYFRNQMGAMRLVNASFASSLECLMEQYPIRWWFCGHIHKPTTKKIHNTTVVLNPRGNLNSYEAVGFRPNVVIDLNNPWGEQ